jgi:hypothetical protein
MVLMRGGLFIGAIIVIAMMGIASDALAVTASVVSMKDNTLYENATGALSNGAGDGMVSGRTGQLSASIRRAVLAFDLSFIPAGATVTSATLSLYMYNTSSGSQPIELHRLTANWGEGNSSTISTGGGAASTTGDSTWIHTFYNTQTWNTVGGDFVSTATATQTVDSIGYYLWSGAGVFSDVQYMVTHPGQNFGWLLLGNETTGQTTKAFASRENSNIAWRPVLSITYFPTAAVSNWCVY